MALRYTLTILALGLLVTAGCRSTTTNYRPPCQQPAVVATTPVQAPCAGPAPVVVPPPPGAVVVQPR